MTFMFPDVPRISISTTVDDSGNDWTFEWILKGLFYTVQYTFSEHPFKTNLVNNSMGYMSMHGSMVVFHSTITMKGQPGNMPVVLYGLNHSLPSTLDNIQKAPKGHTLFTLPSTTNADYNQAPRCYQLMPSKYEAVKYEFNQVPRCYRPTPSKYEIAEYKAAKCEFNQDDPKCDRLIPSKYEIAEYGFNNVKPYRTMNIADHYNITVMTVSMIAALELLIIIVLLVFIWTQIPIPGISFCINVYLAMPWSVDS